MKRFFKEHKFDIILNSVVAVLIGVYFLPSDEIKRVMSILTQTAGYLIVIVACVFFFYQMGKKLSNKMEQYNVSYWSFILILFIYVHVIASAYRNSFALF